METYKLKGDVIKAAIRQKYGTAKNYYLSNKGKFFTDIEMSQISRIVNKNQNITVSTICKLCTTLDITPNMIIFNNNSQDGSWEEGKEIELLSKENIEKSKEILELKSINAKNIKKLSVLRDSKLEIKRQEKTIETLRRLMFELEYELNNKTT